MAVLDVKALIQAREDVDVFGFPLQGSPGDLMGGTAHDEQLHGLVSWGQPSWGKVLVQTKEASAFRIRVKCRDNNEGVKTSLGNLGAKRTRLRCLQMWCDLGSREMH